MSRVLALSLCGVLLLPTPSVLADPPESPAPGIRVRLTAPEVSGKPLVGTLTALERDSLSLRPEGRLQPITLPRTAVTKWEISQGLQANTGKGAAWGFLGGAALGAGLAASEWEGVGAPLVYAGFIGGLGAGIGALLGALHKTERWQEVDETPLRINVFPVRDGVGLSVAWSFDGLVRRPR
jgi:hypothetical protein